MIIGLGIDLVNVNELQTEIDENREEWLERVFTKIEREYSSSQSDPYRSFAGTLAAKEAVMKALETGWTDEADWKEIELTRGVNGKPTLALTGNLLARSSGLGVNRYFLSITHTKGHAAAVVVLET